MDIKLTTNLVDIYQIYFEEEQIQKLDYTPYLNKKCTVFFENSVIKDIVNDYSKYDSQETKHLLPEYLGIVSHKLREKIGITKNNWKNNKNISNTSLSEFTPELFEIELLKNKPDIMSFQRHMAHDPITVADRFHPNFSKYFQHIMNEIGYNWKPEIFNDVFYCNYFVAKHDLYQKYVNEMLSPAMKVMENMPELMQDSKYPHALSENLKVQFGINYYPYHSFLCERMISYFVHLNKLKTLHY